jgi:hypothetical protein
VPPFAVMQRVVELPEPTGRTGLGYRLASIKTCWISVGVATSTLEAGPVEAGATLRWRLRATAVLMR